MSKVLLGNMYAGGGDGEPIPGPQGPQGAKGDKGDKGDTGSTGAQGVAGAVGPAGLNWKGVWSSSTAYVLNDAVSSVGTNGIASSYFAVQAGTNHPPTEGASNAWWALLAQEGPQGAQGIQGVPGNPATNLVTSVQGKQGIVTLAPSDIGAAAAGDLDNVFTVATDAGNAVAILRRDVVAGRISQGIGRFHAALALRDREAVRIAFLGSSTTAGQSASVASARFVNRLTRAIQNAYPLANGSVQPDVAPLTAVTPSAPGIYAFNGGVSGTIANNYVDSTTLANLGVLEPHVILHMIGSNDYGQSRPVATFKSDILATIAAIDGVVVTPHTHILVLSYARWDAGGTPPWSAYGDALQQISEANPSQIAYLDLSKHYLNMGVPSTDPYSLIESDNVHQNDEGHAVMADLLAMELGVPSDSSVRGLLPVNAQSAAYTLVSADQGKAVEVTSATDVNLTVPTNATVPFPIGSVIEVRQLGAGRVTIVGAGITFQNSLANNRTRAQYSLLSLVKRAADTWLISGDCG